MSPRRYDPELVEWKRHHRRIITAAGCAWLLLILCGLAFWTTVIWLAIRLVNHFAG